MKLKKLLQINTVCNGSNGNIMHAIQIAAEYNEYKAITLYGRGYKDLLCEKLVMEYYFGHM